jgi:hypothetical protein
MTHLADVHVDAAPLRGGGARGVIRRICTKNPFYVLSAALFLAGLWISFGDPAQADDTWSMMTGLAGYTLLLAATACLLVRFGNVWDDVRTVLLLVVLMFLATSVTFDQVLVLDPGRGYACYLGGLLLAAAVSEAVLRGIRLRLPAVFRVPYHLILALFFLYPLALSRLLSEPRSEAMMWGLFAFSAAAGLVFLTLLPAARRGPDCVRANGSPWRWPLYPWSLFGVLGLAVPARAFLLCWSMHLLDGPDRLESSVFGPYFVVPFGLAVAVLLLEIGLASGPRPRHALAAALALPAGLVALAMVGHRTDPVYQEFLGAFTDRLGGGPVFLTVLAATAFYAYAALRRVPFAVEALTGALVALAFVGPFTLSLDDLAAPSPGPLVAAALLQLALGLRRRESWRCLLGGVVLATAAALALPVQPDATALRGLIALHLALTAMLIVGAAFDDALAWLLRAGGAGLVLVACLAVLFVPLDPPARLPQWERDVYPLIMAALLAGYGLLLRHRPSLATATLVLACWLLAVGWRGYCFLRQLIMGLDYITVSLALFAVAIGVSLAKSGALSRWVALREERVPHLPD